MDMSAMFLVIILLVTVLIIMLRYLTFVDKPKLPPGPPKLPIIGNLHQLAAKNKLPPHRLQELARAYGPIMHLRLGEIPNVIVSSAEVAKEVFKTHDTSLANRPKLMIGKELYYDFSDIALAPYGEYWRRVRKIAMLELFTAKRVQSFRAIREEEVANVIKFIAVEASAGSLVNLSEKSFDLLHNLLSRLVFGKIGRDREAFRVLLAEMSKALSGFAIADLFPSIKLLYSISGLRKSLKEMVQESDRILDPIIQEHKCNKSHGKVEEDLVDVLLKFHDDNPDNDTNFTLTTKNIKAIILEIFGAGSDTSATTIEWVMSELLKNPETLEKAQHEVRQAYQGKGTIDEARLDELTYLKSVIKETLRLHPPVPLLVPRESIEQCQILGYNIPPETRVVVNAYAIGRDASCWQDANRFMPERFEGSSVDYRGHNFELIPFGAGRRICPAVTLAVANIELPLAMLLYHFDWKLPVGIKSEDLDMDELFGLTMRRKNDLHIIAIPYTYSCHTK